MLRHLTLPVLLVTTVACGCRTPRDPVSEQDTGQATQPAKHQADSSGQPKALIPRQLTILDSLDWSAKFLEAGGLKIKRSDGALAISVKDPRKAAGILAGACLALRKRMGVISENVAHAETSRLPTTPEGSPAVPYRRKILTVTANGALEVAEDKSGFRSAFRPDHPDADKDGKISLPNVYVAVEMQDWRSSCREYEVLRLALASLSRDHVAPPASLLSEPVPPPAYEPKKAEATPAKTATGNGRPPATVPVPVKPKP
jgi:flagellar basal-body rod protein FlgC